MTDSPYFGQDKQWSAIWMNGLLYPKLFKIIIYVKWHILIRLSVRTTSLKEPMTLKVCLENELRCQKIWPYQYYMGTKSVYWLLPENYIEPKNKINF